MRYSKLITVAGLALVFGTAGAQAQPARGGAAPAPTAAKPLGVIATAIPCSDFDRSIAFYKAVGMVAGRPGGNPSEMTMMFPAGGTYFMLQKPRTPTTPLPVRTGLNRVILEVPDLKALADRLAAAGYPLKGRINVNAQYRVSTAQMEDPDGNVFELIQHGP